MFSFGLLETAPSRVGLASITWLALERPDGSRFVVVAQAYHLPADGPGHYLESYEAGQALALPSLPHAIRHALEAAS